MINFSAPFIRRPVATTLLTLALALSGVVAFLNLPVASLPQVDFPTIMVSASLPGASPDTMASSVATPLERSLGRIAGISEMTSTSGMGSTRITLQFDLDRNIDGAARDVQAAIDAARSILPIMPSNPYYRKANPADAPVMMVSLTSDIIPTRTVYDFASTVLAQKLSQVDGVGQVNVGGGSLPAVRVELSPDALNNYGISLDTVRQAIAGANASRPKGMLENDRYHWQIEANDQAKTAEEYKPLVIAWVNGAAVRLMDVANVTDSVQDIRNAGFFNGKRATMMIIFRQPGANIIQTVDNVKATLPQLMASLPAGIDMHVSMDRTPTIRASLLEVERSLCISVALVIMVVFIFLRDWRATLIPGVAVPVSLIGTFGVMYLCGYSLDNLSLMALTIATGFVVDDAIVILENIKRHIEAGSTPFRAAMRGAREVGFTVLSISVSLVAVFIPILFMGGIVGRLFREFAVSLSVAIMVSLLVSLTTTPMMCAYMLRHTPSHPGGLSNMAERAFDAMHLGYAASLRLALRYKFITLLSLLGVVGLTIHLYIIIPKGFFPQQDTGRIMGSMQGDQSISFQAMRTKLEQLLNIVQADPAVESVGGFTGGGQRNSGNVFIGLKPLAERDGKSAMDVINRLRGKLSIIPGATLVMQPAQDVRVGGRQSRAQFQYTVQSDDLPSLRTWTSQLYNQMRLHHSVTDVNSDQEERGLQISLNIDRDAASRLGLTMNSIDSALNNAFGQRQVSTIYTDRNQYRVVMEAAPSYLQSPNGLDSLYVPSTSGKLVPLNSIAPWSITNTPLAVNHQGQFAAATISFNLASGASLSEASQAIDDSVLQVGKPSNINGSFQGTAKVFQDSLRSQPWLIMAAVLTLYIVLGMLYESLIHPLTILSTLPSASVGALLALMFFRTEFSLVALIGVLLLAGIVKKNAIMMIDFAIDAERRRNLAPEEAIYEACLMRFRPIMMTTMAALLGALPLALGRGEGAELRTPLGITVVGGLIMSQMLTLYTTPVIYIYLDRLRLRRKNAPEHGGSMNLPKMAAFLLVALLPVFLSGCAIGPNYERPSVETPQDWKESQALAHNAMWKEAAPGSITDDGWWRVFNDPELDRLMVEVARANQDIAQAEAAYRQARYQMYETRAGFLPTADASGSISQGVSAPGAKQRDTYSVTGQVSWELDLWGKVRRSAEAAFANTEAMNAALAGARLSAQSLAAQNYFTLRSTDEQLALYKRTIEEYAKALTITQNQYNAGIVTKADVAQAETQLSSAKGDAADLDIQRRQTEHALAVLLGKPPALFSLPPAPFDSHLPFIPATLPSILLERRPDVAEAERNVAYANANIGVAMAAFFPTLSISASGGYTGTTPVDLFTIPQRIWAIGPSLALSLFEGGARIARTAQAKAAWESSIAYYRQTVLTAFQDVEDQLAAQIILERESEDRKQAMLSSQESMRLTRNQYLAGTVTYLDVVTAQTIALSNERTYVALKGRRYNAAVQMIKALGGGWDQKMLKD